MRYENSITYWCPPKPMSSKYEFILCEYLDYFEISKGINIKDFQEDEPNRW